MAVFILKHKQILLSLLVVPVTEGVFFGVSATYHAAVTLEIRKEFVACAHLSPPIPTDIDIERPCPQRTMGRYVYVVMLLENADIGDMQMNELRVYSCKRHS